eukprot:11719-Heterococcus_DN1.PRE.11
MPQHASHLGREFIICKSEVACVAHHATTNAVALHIRRNEHIIVACRTVYNLTATATINSGAMRPYT